MSESENRDLNKRRNFLRSGALGAIAAVTTILKGRDGMAADVRYNKKDLAIVNKKLRSSAAERKAFYANPQLYLKRHGIIMSKEMIPSKKEIEASLKLQKGNANYTPSVAGGFLGANK